MRYGLLPGSAKEVSRLVMGTVRADPGLWEAFLERGGTCFDTAHHYGPATELAVGELVEGTGARERLVLVGKGAHTPRCTPQAALRQLPESLERLRTDHVDLYLLHRDNPAYPVEAFAEALHRMHADGLARAVGLSNWPLERIRALDRYAAANGLARVGAVSNQLSLAEMVEPVWDGCLSAFDAASRAWLERTQTPLLAWSAQARGFFAGRAEDDEVRRSWLSAANAARLRRAQQLARRLGVPAVAVAVAWVLHRPFPTFAVVGPRDRGELDDCLAGADLRLTDGELAGLD